LALWVWAGPVWRENMAERFGMVHTPSLYCPRVSVSTKESE